MHTIKLKVKDSLYSHIMYLLNSLDQQEIEIIEDIGNKTDLSTKQEIKALFKDKNVKLFRKIEDPLEWQKRQRDEW